MSLPLLISEPVDEGNFSGVTQRGARAIGSDLPAGGDALSALTSKGKQGGKAGKRRHLGI